MSKKLIISDEYPNLKRDYETTYRKLIHSTGLEKKLNNLNCIVEIAIDVIKTNRTTKRLPKLIYKDMGLNMDEQGQVDRYVKMEVKNETTAYKLLKHKVKQWVANNEYIHIHVSYYEKIKADTGIDVRLYNLKLIYQEFLQGRSVSYIAKKMGINSNTVNVNLNEIRDKGITF